MTRVLVVGLDGATLDLLEPWVDSGHLPNFARLIEEGSGGVLPSTIPPMTPPAWTTFLTGTTPGSHGIFDWTRRKPDSYELSPLSATNVATPTMWKYLSSRNRSSLVINVPMTYPPDQIRGVMIAGMPAPHWDRSVVSPPELFEELEASVPTYELYPDPGEAYSRQGVESFIQRLSRVAAARVDLWRKLHSTEDFDFEMVMFNGTDTAHHALWHLMDTEHPQHDPNAPIHHKEAIRNYYAEIDQYLGEFLDTAAGERRTVLVMSDHGGGPLKGLIHVNNWLLQQGLLQLKQSVPSRLRYAMYRMGFTPMAIYDLLVRIGLGKLKKVVVRGRGRSLLTSLFLSFNDVDWDSTIAYSTGNVGQIYLNVKGREPNGTVDPADYERIRDDLRSRLEAWQHNGEPVVEGVFYPEELWSGENLGSAPDMLFLPKGLEYFGFGEFEFGSNKVFEDLRRGISGTHRMNGIGIWWGAGISKSSTEAPVDQRLQDLAPTIIHLLGEPVPTYMQGRVLVELLADHREVDTVDFGGEEASDAEITFTKEEEALIEERLRGLGYV